MLREQRPLLALSGAALAVVGILSSAVIHGVQFVQQQMIDVAADRGQMVALLQRTEAGIGLKVIFVGIILGLLLGWLILSAALFVTRVVPRAIPVLIVVSFMVNIVKPELGIVSRLFFLIGLGWLAREPGTAHATRRPADRRTGGTPIERLTERCHREVHDARAAGVLREGDGARQAPVSMARSSRWLSSSERRPGAYGHRRQKLSRDAARTGPARSR